MMTSSTPAMNEAGNKAIKKIVTKAGRNLPVSHLLKVLLKS